MFRKKQETQTSALDAATINKLTSKKAAEREDAERRIQAMGPEAVDALLASLQREAENRKKRRNIGIAVVVAWLGLMVLVAAVSEANSIGSFSGMFGMIASLFAVSQTSKNAARALARFDDIREVGPLAEALFYDDKDTARLAGDALVKLLPRMQASDAHLLTDEQRGCLRKAVKQTKQDKEALVLAILAAYRQVGDDRDVPAVQALAESEEQKAHRKRIQAAAQETMPFLEERAEQARLARTLLRPASSPEDLSSVLLRPAGVQADADPATLLRPVEGSPSAQVAAEAAQPLGASETTELRAEG